jgi:hypothetical protein
MRFIGWQFLPSGAAYARLTLIAAYSESPFAGSGARHAFLHKQMMPFGTLAGGAASVVPSSLIRVGTRYFPAGRRPER